MNSMFFSSLNIWPVLVAAAAFWLAGGLWFSALFGKMWATEIEKNGTKIKEPTKGELGNKLLMNLVYNLIAAFVVAYFVYATGSDSLSEGLVYGLAAGVGFTGCTFGISFMWEGRTIKLLLLDIGHSIIGIIACFIILSVWK